MRVVNKYPTVYSALLIYRILKSNLDKEDVEILDEIMEKVRAGIK